MRKVAIVCVVAVIFCCVGGNSLVAASAQRPLRLEGLLSVPDENLVIYEPDRDVEIGRLSLVGQSVLIVARDIRFLPQPISIKGNPVGVLSLGKITGIDWIQGKSLHMVSRSIHLGNISLTSEEQAVLCNIEAGDLILPEGGLKTSPVLSTVLKG